MTSVSQAYDLNATNSLEADQQETFELPQLAIDDDRLSLPTLLSPGLPYLPALPSPDCQKPADLGNCSPDFSALVEYFQDGEDPFSATLSNVSIQGPTFGLHFTPDFADNVRGSSDGDYAMTGSAAVEPHSGATTRRKRVKGGYPCHVCHKPFDTAGELNKHRNRAHVPDGAKQYACSYCTKPFCALRDLNRHVERCSVKVASKSSEPHLEPMRKRRRTESPIRLPTRQALLADGERRHQSARAGELTSSGSGINSSTGVGALKQQAPPNTKSSFTLIHGLGVPYPKSAGNAQGRARLHEVEQTTAPAAKLSIKGAKHILDGYLCETCDRLFRRRCDLYQHHRREHVEEAARPHKCPSCEKGFFDRRDLTRHFFSKRRSCKLALQVRVGFMVQRLLGLQALEASMNQGIWSEIEN